jgi:membrane protease YdiL (CAAX protease family)
VNWDWVALAFAMVYPSFMSWIYFVALATHNGKVNPLVPVVYGAGKLVQFTFPAIYTWFFNREDLRPHGPNLRGMGVAVGFGLFTVAVMWAVYFGLIRGTSVAEVASQAILAKLREFNLATPLAFLLFALFVSVLHSLFEEYYFRWFIFTLLKRHLNLPAAIVLSALAFMAHHIVTLAVYFPGGWDFIALVVLFSVAVAVGGAVWAWIYHSAQSLYAPWLSHMIVDGGIMVVGYDLVGAYLYG